MKGNENKLNQAHMTCLLVLKLASTDEKKKKKKKPKPLRQHVSLNCRNNANTKTNKRKKRQRKYTPKNMFLVYHKYFCVNRMWQQKWQLISP